MDPTLLDDLVAANRILAEHGVIDAYGHVSVRSPEDPQRYFLARAVAPERVQAADLLEYDLDSRARDEGRHESVLERFIHGEVYRARPEVMAVVHNHSPSVVPFSVTGAPMRALFHMAAFVGQGLPNFDIRDVEKGSDLLIRTPLLGKALAKALSGKPAALMRGHGAVVVGQTVRHAVFISIYLELAAKLQMQAMPLGSVKYLTDGEVEKVMNRTGPYTLDRAWENWCRRAGRQMTASA
jgi:ribulose-5-phosphate 4-epimerase/fuculose-1-phosphate aldolase